MLKLTLLLKLEKSAKPSLPANGSLLGAPKGSAAAGVGLGVGGSMGRGGAGRGGGCLLFLGGRAGLGDSGRGGGPVTESLVGACRMANGSQPNGSFP